MFQFLQQKLFQKNHPSLVSQQSEESLRYPRLLKIENNIYALDFSLMKAIPAFYIIEKEFKNIKENFNNQVIETSSGTFALGLAYACKKYNIKLTIVTDSICDLALKNRMESLGTKVIIVDTPASSANVQKARLDTLHDNLKCTGAFWTKQYKNQHNRRHY